MRSLYGVYETFEWMQAHLLFLGTQSATAMGVCVSSWEFGGFSGWGIQSLGIWVRVVGNLGQGVISATAQQSGAEWRGVAEKGRGVAEKGRCIRLRRINDSKN